MKVRGKAWWHEEKRKHKAIGAMNQRKKGAMRVVREGSARHGIRGRSDMYRGDIDAMGVREENEWSPG